MNCPICHSDTKVLRTDGTIKRRRKCTRCENRFTTVEVLEEDHERQQEAVEAVLGAAERLKTPA